jgi:hypothetical protein
VGPENTAIFGLAMAALLNVDCYLSYPF